MQPKKTTDGCGDNKQVVFAASLFSAALLTDDIYYFYNEG